MLWIVEASEGIPEGARERFRNSLDPEKAPPLVVYMEGADRLEAPGPEILELGIREWLADLGLEADAIPVLRGTAGELAAALRERAEPGRADRKRDEIARAEPLASVSRATTRVAR